MYRIWTSTCFNCTHHSWINYFCLVCFFFIYFCIYGAATCKHTTMTIFLNRTMIIDRDFSQEFIVCKRMFKELWCFYWTSSYNSSSLTKKPWMLDEGAIRLEAMIISIINTRDTNCHLSVRDARPWYQRRVESGSTSACVCVCVCTRLCVGL